MAEAVARGLKAVMPELATSVGVQTARAQGLQIAPRPANVEIPVRAWEFQEENLAAQNVGDAAFIQIVQHLVPNGTIGVARELIVTAETPAALADTQVRVLVDGVPVARYDNVDMTRLVPFGDALTVNIKAIEAQRISVEARSRTVGATHNVFAALRGWDSAPSYMANLDTIQGWRGK